MCNKQLRHIYSFKSGEGYNKLVNYLIEYIYNHECDLKQLIT